MKKTKHKRKAIAVHKELAKAQYRPKTHKKPKKAKGGEVIK